MKRIVAKRITGTILAAGFSASVAAYVLAKPPPPDPLGYDRLASKRYVLELERLGGKANVMLAELMQDFRGLWQGENLAYTIAALTVVAAWVFWYVATFPPPNPMRAEPVEAEP